MKPVNRQKSFKPLYALLNLVNYSKHLMSLFKANFFMVWVKLFIKESKIYLNLKKIKNKIMNTIFILLLQIQYNQEQFYFNLLN
jgi:hypothetical protein